MLPVNRIVPIMLLGLLPVAAHAVGAGDAGHYRACLAAASSKPAQALDDALRWSKAGGGLPAQHCAALALVGQGRYREAATRLDTLARAKNVPDMHFRATVFDQAGNAWLLAGDGARAIASLSSALALTGGDADVFADLARAHAMRKEWREVDLDMNAALQLAPRRADLLVLRASARRALGRLKEAWTDIEQALKLHPNDGDALVERGLLRKQIGDIGGAKRDFQAAIKASPSDATAAAARSNLDALSD
jgi:tetratricopeptide (TPR) repeat protein